MVKFENYRNQNTNPAYPATDQADEYVAATTPPPLDPNRDEIIGAASPALPQADVSEGTPVGIGASNVANKLATDATAGNINDRVLSGVISGDKNLDQRGAATSTSAPPASGAPATTSGASITDIDPTGTHRRETNIATGHEPYGCRMVWDSTQGRHVCVVNIGHG